MENKINEINKKLGSIEDGFGITHELNQKNQVIIQKRKKHTDEQIFLDESLKKLANNKIKLDPYLFLASHSKKAYSITDVKSEITKIEASQSSLLLDEEKQEECKLLLKENTMLSLNQITASKPQIFRFFESTKELVSRKIKPSKPITDLIEDNILQEWVRQGIEKHKGKRATCGFCGSILKDDLWIKIDEHFNKESELLRTEINQLIDSLSKAKNNLTSFIQLRKEHFYISLHNKFDKIDKEWNSITQQYEKNIEMLIFKLGERLNDIFIEVEIQEIVDLSERVYLCLVEFNNLIIKHNEMTDSLATDQSKARESLRFNTIEQYLLDIDYNQKKKNLLILEKDFTEAIDEGKLLQLELDALNEEKRQLQAKLQDESKGAELVNDYLSHFFGHNELKLVSEGLSPNIEFKIYRNGNIANWTS